MPVMMLEAAPCQVISAVEAEQHCSPLPASAHPTDANEVISAVEAEQHCSMFMRGIITKADPRDLRR